MPMPFFGIPKHVVPIEHPPWAVHTHGLSAVLLGIHQQKGIYGPKTDMTCLEKPTTASVRTYSTTWSTARARGAWDLPGGSPANPPGAAPGRSGPSSVRGGGGKDKSSVVDAAPGRLWTTVGPGPLSNIS